MTEARPRLVLAPPGRAGFALGAAVALVSVVVVVAAVGCGGGERTVNTPKGEVQVDQNDTLLSQPSPLTPPDLRRFPESSPQRAVLQLLLWAQWGDIPRVFGAYSPKVVDRLGVVPIAGAYSFLRGSLAVSLPRLVKFDRSSDRAAVGVDFLSAIGPPARDSFQLRRVGAGWQVIYDTLLERGLASYASAKKLNQDKPESRVGQRAAEPYRAIAPASELGQPAPPP